MINIESHIWSILRQIKKAENVIEANQYAYYALGCIKTKKEDGKITKDQEEFLLGCIENELKIAEYRLKNKSIDETLALFRPRKEERDEKRSGKSITSIKGHRKRNIS